MGPTQRWRGRSRPLCSRRATTPADARTEQSPRWRVRTPWRVLEHLNMRAERVLAPSRGAHRRPAAALAGRPSGGIIAIASPPALAASRMMSHGRVLASKHPGLSPACLQGSRRWRARSVRPSTRQHAPGVGGKPNLIFSIFEGLDVEKCDHYQPIWDGSVQEPPRAAPMVIAR